MAGKAFGKIFSSMILTGSYKIETRRSTAWFAQPRLRAMQIVEVAPMPYPVLVIDWKKYRELAENIWHAQMAGHPKVLTYNGPSLGRQNRKDAMHFELDGIRQEIMHILSRDEYPFACTVEGGRASWVGHIPPGQNSAQGGLIASFIRANGILPYSGTTLKEKERSKFEVRVDNYHGGQVLLVNRKGSKV
jgi:hypothetical protein